MPTDSTEIDARIARIEAAAATPATRPELIAALLRDAGVRRMAEIGVWRGALSAELLRRCPAIERYVMIDPWRPLPDWHKPLAETPDFDAVHAAAMAATVFAQARREVLRGTTAEVIDRLDDAALDAVYIDGDHSLRGILIDLIAAHDKVRPGGLILGDDLSRDPFQHGPGYEPSLVFPAALHVAEAKGDPILLLPLGQFAILKVQGRAHRVIDRAGGYDTRTLRGLFRLP